MTETENDLHNDIVAGLETTVSGLEQKIARLEAELESRNITIDGLWKQLDNRQEWVDRLSESEDNLQKTVESVRGELAAITAQRDRLQESVRHNQGGMPWQEFDEFKQKVGKIAHNLAIDYEFCDAGMRAVKRNLAELGIPWPNTNYRVSVGFTFNLTDRIQEPSLNDIAEHINGLSPHQIYYAIDNEYLGGHYEITEADGEEEE